MTAIDVPKEIPKRKIEQYIYAEVERLEKRFKYGIEEDERTKFEGYARAWLARQKKYKASTLAGYAKMPETVYPMIGGLPLCKIRAVHLEEMCEELRRRPGKQGSTMSEATVQKYLDTVDMLGHADTAFLERTYCHPQYDYKAQAAHLLNELIVPVDRELYPETDVTA